MIRERFRFIKPNNIVFFSFCIIAIAIMLIQPWNSLSVQAHMAIGFTIILIAGWAFHPFGTSNGVWGLFFLGAMFLAGIPIETVLSGYSQSALWTLIPALFFGHALKKTGLGHRIAVTILKIFPASWLGIIISWMLIGILLSLVTPSMTVRAAIMLPIASYCCELYELPFGSKSSSFLCITALMMAILPGNAWLTGSLTAPLTQGIFDAVPGLTGSITFDTWLNAALIPVAITTILTAFAGYLFLKPEIKLKKEALLSNYSQKAKFSLHEKEAAIILFASCIMFFTNSIHGIPTIAVCLFAAALLFILGVLRPEDISTGINWDLVLFLGSALCMSNVFVYTGLSSWIAGIIAPVIQSLSASPVSFIILLTIFLFIWRFVDVTTLVPTAVILAPIVLQVWKENGISPVVWGIIISLCSVSLFLSYTNMWALMGKKLVGKFVWKESHLFRYGLAFFVSTMIGITCSFPFWQNAGLL